MGETKYRSGAKGGFGPSLLFVGIGWFTGSGRFISTCYGRAIGGYDTGTRAVSSTNRPLREGNLDLLDPYYDQNTIGGSWSLEREQARIKYMGSWLQERNVDLIKAEVMFTRAEEDIGPNEATLSICAHTILTYRHKDYPMAWESTMGWRTVHWLELAKRTANGQ